jgi:hypothetical protein
LELQKNVEILVWSGKLDLTENKRREVSTQLFQALLWNYRTKSTARPGFSKFSDVDS